MYRNVICGAALVMAVFVTRSSFAQDTLALELYGQGVHAYYASQYDKALELLNESIESTQDDPRAYYFRGLAQAALGAADKAKEDFAKGAELEVSVADQPYNIGRALERVQGSTRLEIEEHRRVARLSAKRTALKKRAARYRELESAEKDVLVDPNREAPPTPTPDEAPANPTDPFGDAPATPDAPPADPAAAPADPAADPAATPAKPADPFAEPAADAPAKPADPAAAPAKPADPFAEPAATPAKPADPFAEPAADTPAKPADDAPADDAGAAGEAPAGAVKSLFGALFKAAVPDVQIPGNLPIPGVGAGGGPAGGDPLTPPANDPFGGSSTPPPGAPTQPPADDPFGGSAKPPASDPFGGSSTPPANPAKPPASDPFGGSSTPPANPAKPPANDPFGGSSAPPANDPFGNN